MWIALLMLESFTQVALLAEVTDGNCRVDGVEITTNARVIQVGPSIECRILDYAC